MQETYDIRECQGQSQDQLRDLYSAGKLAYAGQPLFDLYTSGAAHESLAGYLPGWMESGDMQWAYMGYSFDADLFVVGFNGATEQGADADGYYLFKIQKGELSFQGLGLAKGVSIYGKLIDGLRAMYPDLVDLQLD